MTQPEGAWSVELSPSAARALERLPHKVAAAIAEFITSTLPTGPYRMSKPLRYQFEGWRVARRGEYRETFRALSLAPRPLTPPQTAIPGLNNNRHGFF